MPLQSAMAGSSPGCASPAAKLPPGLRIAPNTARSVYSQGWTTSTCRRVRLGINNSTGKNISLITGCFLRRRCCSPARASHLLPGQIHLGISPAPYGSGTHTQPCGFIPVPPAQGTGWALSPERSDTSPILGKRCRCLPPPQYLVAEGT